MGVPVKSNLGNIPVGATVRPCGNGIGIAYITEKKEDGTEGESCWIPHSAFLDHPDEPKVLYYHHGYYEVTPERKLKFLRRSEDPSHRCCNKEKQ